MKKFLTSFVTVLLAVLLVFIAACTDNGGDNGSGDNGSDDNGSDDNGSGDNDGKSLPRTGATIGGLFAGIGAIVVGAGALLASRRRS